MNSAFMRALTTAFATFLLAACAGMPQSEPLGWTEERSISPEYQELRRQGAALIEKIMARYRVPAISIGLVDDTGILWTEGFGYADTGRHVRATARTVYRVGSLAKPLTATAVLQLQDRRQLDIEQPLTRYLPDFSVHSHFDNTRPITVHDLLTHHSGLPCDISKGMWSDESYKSVVDMLRSEYAAYPPGTIFSYSNLGYSLLGQTIEAVSGRDYVAYMEEEFLGPLGMTHSDYRRGPKVQGLLAAGYRNGQQEKMLPIRDVPAMSLYSNVNDLARFMMMILNEGSLESRQYLSAATVNKMLKPQNGDVALDFDTQVGLGWMLDRGGLPGNGTVARHGGTTPLFTSQLILLPEHKLGVVVLSNSGDGRAVVNFIAEQILKLALKMRPQAHLPNPMTAQTRKATTGSTPVDGGRFVTDLGLIDIQFNTQQVCALNLGTTMKMVPYANGLFGVQGMGQDDINVGVSQMQNLKFSLQRVGEHEVMVAHVDGRRYLFGAKVTVEPMPDTWERRAGSYKVINGDPGFPVESFRLVNDAGTLYVEYKLPKISAQPVRIPISPVSHTEAVTLGLGRGRGETLRIEADGDRELIRYSGYLARRSR